MREAILATAILGWLVLAGALVQAKPRVLERDFAMGERIPWYLGVAWVDPYTGSRRLWPIGLNVLAGWGVDAYHWTRAKAERAWLHRLLRDARTDSWAKGYADGREEVKRVQRAAYERGVEAGKRELREDYEARLRASGYKGPERRAGTVLAFSRPRPYKET